VTSRTSVYRCNGNEKSAMIVDYDAGTNNAALRHQRVFVDVGPPLEKTVRKILFVLAILVLLAGAAELCYVLMPYGTLRAFADRMAPDGTAESFTHERFGEMRSGALVAAFSSMILSVMLASSTRKNTPAVLITIGRETQQIITSRFHWRAVVWLGVLAALPLAMRLVYGHFPLRQDEALTYLTARSGLIRSVSDYSSPNNHILHTLAVLVATKIGGASEWGIRFPALASGVLVCILAFVIGRTLYSPSAGYIALALTAVSPTLIGYSTNARGYMPQAAIALVLLPLLRRWSGSDSPSYPFAFAVTAAVSLYLLPTSVFLLVFAATYLLLAPAEKASDRARRMRSFLTSATWAGATATFLYSPALLYSGAGALFANRYVAAVTNPAAAIVESAAEAAKLAVFGWPTVLVGLVIAGWAAALLCCKQARLVTASLTAVLLVAAFVQRGDPPSRVWTFMIPMVFVIASGGIARILCHRALGAAAALGIAVSGSAAAVAPTTMDTVDYLMYNAPYAREVADYLNRSASTADALLLDNRYGSSVTYYLLRLGRHPASLQPTASTRPGAMFLVCDEVVCQWESTLGGRDSDISITPHIPHPHGMHIADERYQDWATTWNGTHRPELSRDNRVWSRPYAAIHQVVFKRSDVTPMIEARDSTGGETAY
jgi:hypothetical protein